MFLLNFKQCLSSEQTQHKNGDLLQHLQSTHLHSFPVKNAGKLYTLHTEQKGTEKRNT